MISSLDAHLYLRATMRACSHKAGWRSLLLRAYEDPPDVEPFTTPATADHLIVLVTEGACNVEGLYRGKWQKAVYGAGTIGMTAPGEQVTLQWRGTTRHSTLQLHIPAETIRSCAQELVGVSSYAPQMPNALAYDDPLLRHVILGLAAGMEQGAPDVYAESAAHHLTMHLLVRHADCRPQKSPSRDAIRMRRVHDYIRARLGHDISLQDLANAACFSRFHLIRMFKHAYGETPYQHLTRLRIEEACRRLKASQDLISNIALDCGFGNQTHFAAAFRRHVGVSPSIYRLRASR